MLNIIRPITIQAFSSAAARDDPSSDGQLGVMSIVLQYYFPLSASFPPLPHPIYYYSDGQLGVMSLVKQYFFPLSASYPPPPHPIHYNSDGQLGVMSLAYQYYFSLSVSCPPLR